MARRVKSEANPVDADLILAREQFEEFADGTVPARTLAEKCRYYRDGNQWTDAERQILKKRKQPCITDNKIQDKCDTLLGIEKQMRTDPKAFPRTPGKEEAAEAATDALRYIGDSSDYNRTVRNPAVDNLMVEGLAIGQVVVEKKKGREPKICMEHIRWDRCYYDLHSLRPDFDDKTYCGYFRWIDYDQAKREFEGKEDALEASVAGNSSVSGANKTLDDKPRYYMTVRSRKRVQVFKHFMLKDGVWHEGVWCRGGWLEDLAPSAYKDEYGEPACCLEFQALYRDSDGNPYGLVQRYLDLQDEHNKRRSKMLHLLNAKRIIAQKGTIEDVAKVRDEVHKPDGVVEVSGSIAELRIEDNLAEAQGQWQLLQQTDQALAATGPNAALQGQSGHISGRAKQLDQQSGTLLVSPLYDALDSWERRMYRQAWMRVRQYWTAEMWIRVTDNEKNIKFVPLNEKVLQGHVAAEQLKDQDMPVEQKRAALEQIAQDPNMKQPVMNPDGSQKVRNSVAEMDVDIIIDRTQDTVNVQQEQFEVLAELAKTYGPQAVPFTAVLSMSQLRSDTKKMVTDQLSGANDPMKAQMAQMQQQLAQLEAGLKQAEVSLKQAEVGKVQAETELLQQKTVDTHIDAAIKTSHAADPVQIQERVN